MGLPTKGAEEDRERHWAASPNMARFVRVAIFVIPVFGAWLTVHLVRDAIYRPDHALGVVVWAVQAIVIASATSLLIDRFVGRFLPLASLLGLSLTFPDQAPSRFSIALRAGTIRKLEAHLAEAADRGLDEQEAVAAKQAIELVTLLGRHERLTRGHTERVRAYSELIAREMGLDEQSRQRLAWAALLHDIGKLTVPAYILNSEGRPSDEEWEILRGHPAAGEAFVAPLADWLGEWRGATSEHHERWDGGGYPRGLAGKEISLAGRIVAAADAFDVITSKRSYKSALSPEAARTELVRCSGTQFDPDVVRALLQVSLNERKPRSAFAWLVELLRLDRVAQAIAVAPAAAAIGLASLGSLLGLTDAGAANAPEQLAFVAPDPSFTEDGTAEDGGAPDTATADEAATASTTIIANHEKAFPPDGDGPTTTLPTDATTTVPAGDVGSGSSTTTTGATDRPLISTPFGTIPAVTLPGTFLPDIPLPEVTIPGVTVPPILTTTTTAPSTTTSTTAPTTTTTSAPSGPTANNDSHGSSLGLIRYISVLSNDTAGSSALDLNSLRVVAAPSSGSAEKSTTYPGTIKFTTPLIFISTTFTYEICDMNGLCDQATVTVFLL